MTQAALANPAALRMNAAVVSVRQAAEWGMHSLQSVFHRLTVPFPCDVAFNQQVLDIVLHLFNFRARWDGNQTRTVFEPCDALNVLALNRQIARRDNFFQAMIDLLRH
jgi:hypothetical protein